MSTFWPGIATQARAPPKHRVGTLDEWRHEASLRACWSAIRQDAASGVDHVSAEASEQPLEANMHDRVERRQGKRSRAQRVTRHDLPNGHGQRRPRGRPAVEDKRRPRAVARRLEAIDEPDVRRGRDGDRPQVGALDAVDTRTITRPCGRYHVVVDADLTGCVDHLQPAWVMRRWADRLEDGAVRRRSRTWRQAGVLATDGPVIHPVTGTPPGGVSAPLLANGSRHAARDRWLQHVVKPRGGGEACLIRDADDGVAAWPDPAEAARCDPALGPRLGQFGRAVAPDKTRVMPFRHQPARGRTSVDCLGLEGRWGTDRAGTPPVKRRTARTTRRHSSKRFTAWCRDPCRRRVRDVVRDLHANRRGDDRSAGVHGNSPSLPQCVNQARRIRCTWLNRRRQRRSDTWTGFTARLRHVRVERPRLVGRPNTRMAALAA